MFLEGLLTCLRDGRELGHFDIDRGGRRTRNGPPNESAGKQQDCPADRQVPLRGKPMG
jgi:hypothetical protein